VFEWLFGSRKPRPPARDVRALTHSFAVPAVHVVTTDAPVRSHWGGAPALPVGFSWPRKDGNPLGFLARVQLGELHAALPIDWLPRSGALLFFYDMERQPWGFDPGDRGGSAVVHVADDDSQAGGSVHGVTSSGDTALPHRRLAFRRLQSFPSGERAPVAALDLTEGENERYSELRDAQFEGAPQHQIGGFPSPVQSDEMELECQLVSHGLYCGDPSGYADPRAAELGRRAADWRLLLQLDSDDDLDVMWGDVGKIYFWIREQDARAHSFDRAWLVLQCG
jgi:uncharacterized protein YwqG